AFLAAAVVAGVLVGPAGLSAGDVAQAYAAKVPLLGVHSPLGPTESTIVFDLRLPRVALGALVGAMLAVAGGAYQGVFRNPLADPYLLGIAAGAGFGATLVIAYGPAGSSTSMLLPAVAFAGGAGSVVVTYLVGRGTTSLILAGVTVAAFFTALETFVQQQRSESIRDIYAWLLGQLETSGWTEVGIVAPYALVAAGTLIAHRRLLDVLRLGDDEAAALGVDVARVRLAVIVAATLGTAAAVAVSGLIGFVGIIVPHAIRLLVGGSYRVVLPLSIVVGAGFLVFADLLARTVLSPAELPIGVVTAFFGAPFFALVLRTTRLVGA
ncbi:MAG TPA: iron ABC transporter permease, partial [Solirubrobacteraceae bacterium]|nr:iron ABC transporter permease [Solirubrobacteraceae bacterium]